ncbi:unnamed protein product [Sphagnum compactum]
MTQNVKVDQRRMSLRQLQLYLQKADWCLINSVLTVLTVVQDPNTHYVIEVYSLTKTVKIQDYSRLNTCISPGLQYNSGSIRPLQANSIPSISHVMNSWVAERVPVTSSLETIYVAQVQSHLGLSMYSVKSSFSRPATDLKSVVLYTEAVNQVQPHIHKSCISGFKAADYKSRT